MWRSVLINSLPLAGTVVTYVLLNSKPADLGISRVGVRLCSVKFYKMKVDITFRRHGSHFYRMKVDFTLRRYGLSTISNWEQYGNILEFQYVKFATRKLQFKVLSNLELLPGTGTWLNVKWRLGTMYIPHFFCNNTYMQPYLKWSFNIKIKIRSVE